MDRPLILWIRSVQLAGTAKLSALCDTAGLIGTNAGADNLMSQNRFFEQLHVMV